jgi:hypothetical protein
VAGTARGNLVTWVPVREDVMDQNLRLGRLLRLEEEAITVLAETEGLLILGTVSGTLTLMDQAGSSPLTSAFLFSIKQRTCCLFSEYSLSYYGVKM